LQKRRRKFEMKKEEIQDYEGKLVYADHTDRREKCVVHRGEVYTISVDNSEKGPAIQLGQIPLDKISSIKEHQEGSELEIAVRDALSKGSESVTLNLPLIKGIDTLYDENVVFA